MYTEIVAFVFRFVNFAVIVAVGVYLYRRYAPEFVYSPLNQKKELLNGLQQENIQLIEEQQKISLQIQEQNELQIKLQDKIRTWSQAIDALAHIKEKETLVYLADFKKKTELQTLHLQEIELQKIALTQALAQARTQLNIEFESTSRANLFEQQIVTYMKKGAQ